MLVNFTYRHRPLMGAALLLALLAAPALAEEPKKPAAAPEGQHTRVKLRTSVGDIVLELYDDKSPVSVENFLQYVRDGFYDGIAFHRVVKGFMIQTGGFNADLSPRTNGLRGPIKNESGNLLKNERGTVAMARMSDPHSATSQFFINVVDNPHLDRTRRQPYGYAVFGKVVEGMDVVDKIQNAPCIQHPNDPRGGADGPVNPNPPITIKEATILEPQAPSGASDRAGAKAKAEDAPEADDAADAGTPGAPE